MLHIGARRFAPEPRIGGAKPVWIGVQITKVEVILGTDMVRHNEDIKAHDLERERSRGLPAVEMCLFN